MTFEVIMAGHGGQGIMLMGQLLSYAGMLEGKHVTWMPSYGPEMRGGTANCTVVLSDEPVGSPVVSRPFAVIAMNTPSMLKFEPQILSGGILIYNSSLIKLLPKRDDIRKVAVAANDIAERLGNMKIANMAALGAFIAATGAVRFKSAAKALKKALPPHRKDLLTLNLKALIIGDGSIEGTDLMSGSQ